MLNDICDICKEHKTVHTNRETGKNVCDSCRRKDPSKHEKCSKCGSVGRVAVRHLNRDAICDTCRGIARKKDKSKHEKCSACEKVRYVAIRNEDGGAICNGCHNKTVLKDLSKYEKCSVCGKKKYVEKDKNGVRRCRGCKNKARYHNLSKHKKCSKCGDIKPVASRDKKGKAICPMCWRRSKVSRCTRCKKKNVIKAEGLCHSCYKSYNT